MAEISTERAPRSRQRAAGDAAAPGAESQDVALREKRELQREEGTREGTWYEPPVDIYETEQALVLLADVPGVAAGDVDVDLRENVLTITGRAQPVEERWRPIYQEYRIGHYMRQFRLGQHVDQARISGRVKDGVLMLTLPKAESALPKKIQIQTGE